MAEFWNLIVQSNTFNFAILVLILAVVFVKIDLPSILEKIKNDVANSIKNAQNERENAQNELKSAQKTAKNTDNETAEKLKNAEERADMLAKGIIKSADARIKDIEDNIERVISSEDRSLSAKLTQGTVIDAIERAERQILDKLGKNPELHKKFLDTSIEEISGVRL